jgi:2-succinyl-5-enolpyruvyl-6-hydroxy-3-cyclohexene-1-carboxylate synthase
MSDFANRNTAIASAFADELSRAGVAHACISPGSRSAPLALALWNAPGMKVWSHVDERCAGFFAIGIAQQTGRPAVVLTTSGTAGANLHPAVAEAAEARVPLIVVTADRPPELRGRGAGQTIDQLKLYGDSVRWFCEVGVQQADDTGLYHVRAAAARAAAESVGRPTGPVHLNFPLQDPLAPDPVDGDVAAEDPLAREGRTGRRPLTSVLRGVATPDDELASQLALMIDERPRGIVLAGRQRDASIAAAAAAFAAACGYPLLPEPTSQLRGGVHDLSGVIAPYDAIFRTLPDHLAPELVVRVGDMVTSKAVRQWLGANRTCRQVVIDPDGAWNEPTWSADLIARADPEPLLGAFAEQLERRADRSWLESWRDARDVADREIDAFLDGLGDEPFEPRVHRALADLLPSPATVYVGSSMPVRDLETFLPAIPRPVRFLANRGANGIDGLVSSGLGAAAVAPGRTFVLTGDVGLYHDMNGLLASRRLGVEATIVVLNNGGGGIFEFLPIARHRDGWDELFGTPTGLDLGRVAALYDLPFTRVEAHSALAAALEQPGMIELVLDRERNVELHRALFERVSGALRS